MNLNALIPYATSFGLVLVRCTGVVMMVPVFSGTVIPKRITGALAVALAVVFIPLVGPMPFPGWTGVIIAAMGEMLLGVAMGLVLRLVLAAADLAGELAGMQMGFSFSRVVDPLSHESKSVTSQIMGLVAALLLIAIDGHHMILAGLANSLREAPVGTVFPRVTYCATLVPLLTLAMSTGMRMAAPVIVALLATNGALALIARAAPQLNLFVMSFALGIGIGMIILAYSIGPSLNMMVEHLRHIPEYVSAMIGD